MCHQQHDLTFSEIQALQRLRDTAQRYVTWRFTQYYEESLHMKLSMKSSWKLHELIMTLYIIIVMNSC